VAALAGPGEVLGVGHADVVAQTGDAAQAGDGVQRLRRP
jgi:hypothetical protein